MFERLTTGWELAKESFRVLRLDKELLLFPIFSGVACVLVMASFAVPMFLTGAFDFFAEQSDTTTGKIIGGLVAFAFYFVNYFVIIFFNSALVGCAVIRLKGGDPTVSDGFTTSMSRIPQIIGWALVSATVGMILKGLEQNSNKIGQFIIGLLGMAWSIMTFFVVPVLVIEKLGPIDAVKRSVSLMKQTWGESLAANFSLKIIVFLASLLAIAPIVGGVFFLSNQATFIGFGMIALGVVLLLAISLISSALNSIVLAALYVYAVEGKAPAQFDSNLIRQAFAPK